MKKQQLNKKEILNMLVEQIQDMLKYMHCEAIVYVPDYGTISEFSTELGRAKVLGHAKREIKMDEMSIENDALNWFITKKSIGVQTNGEKEKTKTYIG
jgi:hypothetical protein